MNNTATATSGKGSGKVWRRWVLIALIALAPATISGIRPSIMGSGGGGSDPAPPDLQPNGPTLGVPSGEYLRLPLVVAVDGPLPNYMIAVTTPSQGVVALGVTNDQGIVVLKVPADAGLELDVIGTSVVGLPVHAGQVVAITIP